MLCAMIIGPETNICPIPTSRRTVLQYLIFCHHTHSQQSCLHSKVAQFTVASTPLFIRSHTCTHKTEICSHPKMQPLQLVHIALSKVIPTPRPSHRQLPWPHRKEGSFCRPFASAIAQNARKKRITEKPLAHKKCCGWSRACKDMSE
jgi:hypothetical protein